MKFIKKCCFFFHFVQKAVIKSAFWYEDVMRLRHSTACAIFALFKV